MNTISCNDKVQQEGNVPFGDPEKGNTIAVVLEDAHVDSAHDHAADPPAVTTVTADDDRDDRRKGYAFAGIILLFVIAAATVSSIPGQYDRIQLAVNSISTTRDRTLAERTDSTTGSFVKIVINSTANITGHLLNYSTVPDIPAGNATKGTKSTKEEKDDLLVTIDSPFPTTVRLFSPDILQGYANVEELKSDLVNASWFMINNVYRGNMQSPCGGWGWGWGSSRCFWRGGRGGNDVIAVDGRPRPMMATSVAERQSAPAPRAAPAAPASPRGAPGAPGPPGAAGYSGRDESANTNTKDDSWGTNNQEEGVEEGDLIISDGRKVYAAYGDYIVAWNARSGRMLARVQMPSVEDMLKEGNGNDITGTQGTSSPAGKRRYYYYSKPYIRSLLLHRNRLVVIVGGYGRALRDRYGRSDSILYDLLNTHVRVYDTTRLAGNKTNNKDKKTGKSSIVLSLLGSMHMNGRFSAVRAVGGNVHVVTTSGLNTYRHLQSPFDPWNFDFDLSDQEYMDKVKDIAETRSIPNFVNGLVKELRIPTGKIPNLAKIAVWQSGGSSGSQLERATFSNGLINNLVQVYSFDVIEANNNANDNAVFLKEKVKVSGSFLPTSWQQVYGTPTDLILAGEGWEFDRWARASSEGTYLLAMRMDGPSTTMRSVGHVPGRVLNSYSMDVVEDVGSSSSTLRIATTLRNRWRMRPIPLNNIGERFEVEQQSTTKNYVFTLDLDGSSGADGEGTEGMIEERGRLKLGKPNEVFTAVRYFDNIAYAVTFERTDPFYVLNLTNPDAPAVLAELNITGFSSYLHSMNADNSLILAIGQEADDNGRVLGVKVTVFDARIPDKPVAIQNYVVEQDSKTWSGSEALRNFKAARYAGGRLIIPLDIYNWRAPENNFRGFSVFLANENTIQEECRISHDEDVYLSRTKTAANGKNDTDNGETAELALLSVDRHCFYCASLPRRSMMFDGLMMTTDKHLIESTNTSACVTQWIEPIVVEPPRPRGPGSYRGCCGF